VIHPGFTIDNLFSKTHTVVLESDLETQGRSWLIEVHCQPGSRPEAGEHLHLLWTETFEIVSGTAYYKLDGNQQTAQAGEKFVVVPHHPHVHPWNAGDTDMVYRQGNQFEQPNPQAVQDILGVIATMARLARTGKLDNKGLPKNLLQLGAILKMVTRHGVYDTSFPIPVQDFVAATLGSLAEALGYKAVYPQYMVSQ